ncbi:hypothetical protein C8Q78DRAFT_978735 [Trametes maxima]|nr:hypothetical protein C8Q78DRAFT_978735 [Trametes maxima]
MSNELVIVVTGANSGVGFGICHRLLVQLSYAHPSDAEPHFNVGQHKLNVQTRPPDAGTTIVMACRDPKRAQDARDKLYRLLDKHIAGLRKSSDEHAYATAFRRSVRLDTERLDLASVKSVLDFGRTVSQKYEYISHLIFNAGTATYSHFDLLGFTYDLFTHPIHAIEHVRRNIQTNGVLSKDNLGYAWQCNVFGHYVLYRTLQPLLLAYGRYASTPARVLWMSSIDSEPLFDPKDDWQLTKTLHSYHASKFEIEAVSSELERRTIETEEQGGSSRADLVAPHGEFHHYIVSPGITSTNMSTLLNIPIPGWQYLMLAAFWFVRFIGSPHVLMSLYSAAVATVHVALAPLRALPTVHNAPHISPADIEYPTWHAYHGRFTHRDEAPRVLALRFGSENDRWGRDYPGVTAVPVWEEHSDLGATLLERFERLYQTFLEAERGEEAGVENETQ